MKKFSDIIYIILLVVFGTNCQAQTKFNIVTDFGHREMNIFNSITPLDDGYIIVVGTGNDTLFNDNRCSMIVKTDVEGNKLYSNFIGNIQYDVYESIVSGSSVFVTDDNTYKFIFNVGRDKKLLSYEFDNRLQILDTIQIRTDSINIPRMLCNIYTGDYIYVGGQYLQGYCEYLIKYDTDGNIIAESERVEHVGIDNIILETSGNVIAAGLMSNNNHDWIVQKLDTLLNIIWQKNYGRNDMKNGSLMFFEPSPDSCYVMSGVSQR